ncbi:MAG: fibronectin type III domain-containing protein, partial [Anaerolineae bacterium]|nr:fibronectin type III domain-containing protein [Anaerolineae bacterium]
VGSEMCIRDSDGIDIPLLPEPPTHLVVRNLGDGRVQVSWRPPATNTPGLESDPPTGYRVYTSTDGVGWSAAALVTTTVYTLTGVPAGQLLFVRVTAVNAGGESFPTEVLGTLTPTPLAPSPSPASGRGGGGAGEGVRALLVSGFDRLNRTMLVPETDPVEGYNLRMLLDRMNARNYVLQHGQATSLPFDSASNEAVRDGNIALADYGLVNWILGEESASDQTLDPTERALLRAYLDGCGALLVSGTEIGWHLDGQGADPDFYRNTLRAQYVADDAGTYVVTPTVGSVFAGLGPFRFDAPGMYDPDFPDVISPTAGSAPALTYVGGTGGTAAVQYADGCSRLLYFAFPLETIDPSARAMVMEQTLDFLTTEPSVVRHRVFLPLVLRDFGSSPSPVVVNGGFETDGGWTLNRLAAYDTSLARSGARSMRLGILPGEPGQYVYSSVSQSFAVPEGPAITLSLWVYLRTGGDRDDLFYVSLYDGSGQYRLLDSWRPGDLPEGMWVERRVDLTPYEGQQVTLYIGVKNDGDSLNAAMNVDDVGVQ